MDSNLHTLSDNANSKTIAATKNEIFSKVCEYYKNITDQDCNSETNLKELDKDQLDKLISLSLAFFNVDNKPDSSTINSISDLVNYISENDGTATENILKQVWDSFEFLIAINQLDKYIDQLELDNVSQEGLMSGLLKVFTGIVDTFLSIANTFKTNIFKFTKTLKRSEIRAFYESNMLMVKRVEGIEYTKVMDVQMNIPTGMIAKYADSINFIKFNFENIDLESYADYIYNELKSIRTKLCNSDNSYQNGFAPASQIKQRTEFINNVIKKQTSFYTDKRTDLTKPFKDVYSSMTDFKATRTSLTDMEEYLCNATNMTTKSDNISLILGDITTYLSTDNELNVKFVRELAESIRLLATLFDVYGQTAMRQMALEHNHILNYSTLYKLI